jgi:integrase/recombinase XerC
MPAEIVPAGRPAPPAIAGPPRVAAADLYAALLADARTATTRRARVQDVEDLARFLGLVDPSAAAAAVVAGDAGGGNALGLAYRAHLAGRSLSAATINRRLSTLRRLVDLARRFGVVSWSLDLDGMRSRPYRDTAGPGRSGMAALVASLKASATAAGPKGVRDWALVALVYSAGLRRGEAAALDLADLDLDSRRVRVVGKGTSEPRWLPMSRAAAEALSAWLAVRPSGGEPSALFVRLDTAAPGAGRLSADGIHHIIAALGRRAGLSRPLAPHQLRHAAISSLAVRTGGDLPRIQRFSRHAKLETVGVYVDQARDDAAELAELLGGDL